MIAPFVLILLLQGHLGEPPQFGFRTLAACEREAKRWIEADRERHTAFCLHTREPGT